MVRSETTGQAELTILSYSQLIVAALLLALALFTLRGGPRKGVNRIFALFLILVAGNFAAGFFAEYFTAVVGDLAAGDLAYKVSLVFLALDPAVLLYFSWIFPRRRPVAGRPVAVALLMMVPLLVIAARWTDPTRGAIAAPTPYRLLLVGYLAACYLAALMLIVSAWLQERVVRRWQVQRILVVAFGTAILPRMGAIPADLGWGVRASSLVVTWSAFVLVFGYALLLQPGRRREILKVAAATGLLVALIVAAWVPVVLGGIQTPITGVYTFRWLVFGSLVGYAILRYQVFEVDLQVRRGLAVAIGASVVGLTYWGLSEAVRWLRPDAGTPLSLAIGVLGAVLVLLPAARVAQLAARRLVPIEGPMESFLQERKADVYEAALAAARDDGRDPESDPDLLVLRARLGLSTSDHRSLLSLLDAERGVGIQRSRALRKGFVLDGRYRVGDQIGGGSQGRTYRAERLPRGGTVVVKELRTEASASAPHRERFLREARLLRDLDHPSVVRLLDAFEAQGVPYLVLEHMEGGSLEDRLRAKRPAPREALSIVSDVLDGLQALHARGIVHRDLKPSNILFTGDGRAKIADLGIARLEAGEDRTAVTGESVQPGTLRYMSPEQARNGPVDRRSDVYSVGIILYEMLMGESHLSVQHLRGASSRDNGRVQPRLPLPGLARPLNAVLAKSLAPAPSRRFASAQAFRSSLDAVLRDERIAKT